MLSFKLYHARILFQKPQPIDIVHSNPECHAFRAGCIGKVHRFYASRSVQFIVADDLSLSVASYIVNGKQKLVGIHSHIHYCTDFRVQILNKVKILNLCDLPNAV